MDLASYVDTLRTDLLRAAEAAGPDGLQVAERLALALDPAMRMVLLEALSDAAAQITADLPHAAVEVRLRGREPQFVVSATEPIPDAEGPERPTDDDEDEDASISRVTVRLPESLKLRAEEAAANANSSLNTWIVSVIRRATRGGGINIDVDLAGFGSHFGPSSGAGPAGFRPGAGHSPRRIQGWVR
ncbi:MAG: toxin-antitoxin system HicB family antitoxin [Nocardioidaceae bacterium]